MSSYLISHYDCEVFQELSQISELLSAHGDYGALEELVVVDEETDFPAIKVSVQ